LELGGKSPVIVEKTADLDATAKRVAWGKFFNDGQVCIAPDYLLVDESIRAPFIEKLKAQIEAMSAEGSRGVIVNERHAHRIQGLVDGAVRDGAEVLAGGSGPDARGLAPTVLANVRPDAPVMREEIFGPVLPLLTFRNLDDALREIDAREKPLVLYLFTKSRRVIEDVLAKTRAGGTAINHTMLHFYQLNLPFGGIGNSGVGKGHGFFGFEAFSNARGVLEQRLPFSTIELMFPPYTKLKQKFIDLTLRWF
ncbi:MAG: aldehyde dehydrogenase family protein, partial [Acidobacteria bacterium]|nr:aldehyde dehydrogenase family protein [Acidobacteriota bacterium]